MANLDTKLKRASGMYIGQGWRLPAKFPTGSVVLSERQSVGLMYSGIAASVVAQIFTRIVVADAASRVVVAG